MPTKPESGWVIRVRLANGTRPYLTNEDTETGTGLVGRLPWSPRDHDAQLFVTEDEALARAATMQTNREALEYEVCTVEVSQAPTLTAPRGHIEWKLSGGGDAITARTPDKSSSNAG